MRNFKELKVWQKAHQLVMEVYGITSEFPSDERFGLTTQRRRSAASVPANIAEGCGRGSDGELVRFCQIALGSASELEYHLLFAHDLGYLQDAQYFDLHNKVTEVKRMATAFTKRLKADR